MRYILSLFLALALFSAPSFSQKKEVYKVRTIVIDPGHGGAKPGAIGSRTTEKAIVLSIAKKFGKLIADNYPDVKIIYTRTTDVDISLAERAHIANRNKADLFVSVHANSHPTSSPTGVETFVMGLSESRANLAVAQKENADILLEADYKENADYKGFDPNSPESYVMLTMFQNAYLDKRLNFAQAIQNQYKQNLKTINRGVKQAELFVLYKTTCPSVLTEVGFISNPTEEAFMMSDEGQAKIAVSLFNAFMIYKATEEGTGRIANPKIDLPGYVPPAPPEPVETTENSEPSENSEVAENSEASEPVVEQPAVEQPAVEQPAVVEQPRPVPSAELAAVLNAPKTQTPPSTPNPPSTSNTPSAPSTPTSLITQTPQIPPISPASQTTGNVFFTVQFLSSDVELKAGAPEFQGLTDVMLARNGKRYCYSVGRFATFTAASEYCKELQNATPFKDAWALRRTTDKVTNLESPQATQSNQSNQNTQNTPSTQNTQPATPNGMTYRVQIFTSKKVLKAGDPDLHGLKDFHCDPYGQVFLYTVGDYQTVEEARRRAAEVRATTPLKDAFVIGFKDGKKFILNK